MRQDLIGIFPEDDEDGVDVDGENQEWKEKKIERRWGKH